MSFNYDKRGVSADKNEVHAAIKNLDKGLFPTAFCKVLPDVVGGDPDYCNIMHADTAGTKTSLAYLYWKETGDVNVWKGIAQDALVMNLDDMACVGCYDDIVISSTIGRNKHLITGEVIKAVIEGTTEFAENMERHGIRMHLSGGETADVGDIVRTIDVGYTTFGRMKRSEVLVNDIRPGDAIVSLASFGQSVYESRYNSGMGSNGLTSARHDVLSKYYAENYPESYNPLTPDEVVYIGQHRLTDPYRLDDNQSITIGDLLLSPTRTYLPVVRAVLSKLKEHVHGLIHCTGGGQTKVLKFTDKVHIIKNNLGDIPPVFRLIQQSSGTSWREMYQVFNMGRRLEFYVNPAIAEELIGMVRDFGIDAVISGHVEPSEGNKLTVDSPFGVFEY